MCYKAPLLFFTDLVLLDESIIEMALFRNCGNYNSMLDTFILNEKSPNVNFSLRINTDQLKYRG